MPGSSFTNVTVVDHTAIMNGGFSTMKMWSDFPGNNILEDAPTMGATPCPWRDIRRLSDSNFINATHPYHNVAADVYYDEADKTSILQQFSKDGLQYSCSKLYSEYHAYQWKTDCSLRSE